MLRVLPAILLIALMGGCAKKSTAGETCTKSADCRGDLRCIGSVCTDADQKRTNFLLAAQLKSTRTQIDNLTKSVMTYAVTHRRLPKNLGVLVEKKYIRVSQLRDTWRNPFHFKAGATGELDDFTLCSSGPDATLGTEDDICAPRDTE